ncbi:MAG: hypothetical protein KGZ93_11210 [Actinobacteria bacterium]|nr:hypothetical protein [Actinomycetota bacterium]
MAFSTQLVQDTKEHFKKKYGLALSDEKAVAYLEQFAEFGSLAYDHLFPKYCSTEQLPCGESPVPYSKTTADAVVESGEGDRSRACAMAQKLGNCTSSSRKEGSL